MLVEFALIGVAIAAIMLFLGFQNEEKKVAFLVAGAIVLIITGLFIAADTSGIEVQTYGGCMNGSYENSYVWSDYCNVSTLVNTSVGHNHLAANVITTDYASISGTVSDTYTVNGVYYDVEEWSSGRFNITYNFSSLNAAVHTLNFTGRYEGNPAHYASCLVLNWVTNAYEYCDADPTNDFTDSATDYVKQWNVSSPQYYSASSALGGSVSIRIWHGPNPAVNHHMLTDYISLEEPMYEFILTPNIIDCTRDQYNTTYTYGSCYNETLGFNFSQAIAIMLMLVGIAAMLGIFEYLRKDSPFKEE